MRSGLHRPAGQLAQCVAVMGIGLLGILLWQYTQPGIGAPTGGPAEPAPSPQPCWIGSPDYQPERVPSRACHFRRSFHLADAQHAYMEIGSSGSFQLYVNGRLVQEGEATEQPKRIELEGRLHQGDNTVAVRVMDSRDRPARMALRLVVTPRQGPTRVIVSDAHWKASTHPAAPGWYRAAYYDRQWRAARTLDVWQVDQPMVDSAQLRPSAPVSATVAQAAHASTESGVPAERNTETRHTSTAIPTQIVYIPTGFQLEHLIGNEKLGSLIAMTFDEFGRIIAARENGPLLLVDDSNQDGRLDRVQTYCDQVTNCQGLLALNGDLYVVGHGPEDTALYQLKPAAGQNRMTVARSLLHFEGTSAEHGAHAVTLGFDGMLYVVVGNHARLKEPIARDSVYRHFYEGDLVRPRYEDPGGHAAGVPAPGGVVVRTDLAGRRVEYVAGGLRNPYDLAFDRFGDLYTHDADMESDQGTSWYRPTRIYLITEGAEFGWRSGWAKWPSYYYDSLPEVAQTGRGSPAGIVFYHHHQFPEPYRDALFTCDWSEGRVLVTRLMRTGSAVRGRSETFLEAKPLNATDIEVGPDGWLYFVTGGRGSAGNLYRITWHGSPQPAASGSPIEAVLQQPQLQSSWARQHVAIIQQNLGTRWSGSLVAVARDVRKAEAERLQALSLLEWLGPLPDTTLLIDISRDRNDRLRTKAASVLGLSANEQARKRLLQMLKDPSPLVRRKACESLLRGGYTVTTRDVIPLLLGDDRFEVFCARRLLEQIPPDSWRDSVLNTRQQRLFLEGGLALMTANPTPEFGKRIVDRCAAMLRGFVNDRNFIDLLRLLEVTLHRTPLARDDVPQLAKAISDEFPSADPLINRELIRLIVYFQDASALGRILDQLDQPDLTAEQRLHLSLYAARLDSGWSTAQKLRLLKHLEPLPAAGNSVPGYVHHALRDFGQDIQEDEVAALLDQGEHCPAAALAALAKLPTTLSQQRLEQVIQLDQRIRQGDSETFRRLKVAIVAALTQDGSEPAVQYLREVYDRDPIRRAEVALGLAQHPDESNWPYLVKSVPILDAATTKEVLQVLRTIPRKPEDGEAYRQVILAAQRLGDQGADSAIALLEYWQGLDPNQRGSIPWRQALEAWLNWFQQTYPTMPTATVATATSDGKWDFEELLEHVTRAEQESQGSADRGRAVFEKAQCAKCHRCANLGESVGPDLTGLSKRFLRREMLDSIVNPSNIISDQYAAKTVVTNSGKTIVGIVTRQGADELVLIGTDGNRVHIATNDVEQVVSSPVSIMPAGLLDSLSLDEIVDLFAYLSASSTPQLAAPSLDGQPVRR